MIIIKNKLILFDWGNIVESHLTGFSCKRAFEDLFRACGYTGEEGVYERLSKYKICEIPTVEVFEDTYNKIKLLKSFNASNYQIYRYLIFPGNINGIINALKVNISMSLIGVIMGEFLVSKAGIGYLILYGTQVFNLNLVMSGIVLIMAISFIIYLLINMLEKWCLNTSFLVL